MHLFKRAAQPAKGDAKQLSGANSHERERRLNELRQTLLDVQREPSPACRQLEICRQAARGDDAVRERNWRAFNHSCELESARR
ncbi:MAG: hypothetical protein PHV13_01785 [Candidatus ainarchaeum sp.]|nr:hypothetical protein [Candidatus ainarchaeum sp.]